MAGVTHEIFIDYNGKEMLLGKIMENNQGKFSMVLYCQIGSSRKPNTLSYCLGRIKKVAPKAVVRAV